MRQTHPLFVVGALHIARFRRVQKVPLFEGFKEEGRGRIDLLESIEY